MLTVAETTFLAEVQRCRGNFRYFCRTLLRIDYLERNRTRTIPLKLNLAQLKTLESLDSKGTTYVLKARRLGITTFALAYMFHKIMFNKGYRCATLAHTNEAAEEIFKAVHKFHEELPDAWKQMFPLTLDSANMMQIRGGGSFRIGSARSPGFRGSGLNMLHLSEFALYPRIDETLEAVAATMPPGARTLWETTPQGLNRAYDIWMGDPEKDGISRIFFPWTMEPRYSLDTPPNYVPEDMIRYREDNPGLKTEQYNWAVDQYLRVYPGNLAGFNREYPINATVAFVVSGDRVFPSVVFPDALSRFKTGHMNFEAPREYHTYSAGADVAAGGPKGDYSAFAILDVTDREKPRIVHTFYDRITTPEFAKTLGETCANYRAVLAVERNNHGGEILNRLVEDAYPYLYTKERVDTTTQKWTTTLGFDTSSVGRPLLIGHMHEFIGSGKLKLICPRAQLECNTFEYITKPAGQTRAEHRAGTHDDMLFSIALAIEASSQTHQVAKDINEIRPETLEQIFAWERANKRKYRSDDQVFGRDEIYGTTDSGNQPIRSVMYGRRDE